MSEFKVAILGGGKMGISIAHGLVKSGMYKAEEIIITKRNPDDLKAIAAQGFATHTENWVAVEKSELLVISVRPQQLDKLMQQIRGCLKMDKHKLISIVTGVEIKDIRGYVGQNLNIVRAMPNTAISIRESMTCITADDRTEKDFVKVVEEMFNTVGTTMVIREDQMLAATALCACGIAFFMRAIRAASQGGTEISFHAEEALRMAAQTAKGAGALLLANGTHPEQEIDNVTSPSGCTIAGLNQMEHNGFSSAMIKGIILSAQKAGTLYKND
jgi:pyrroline-5-carboxylate reductase